MAQEEDLDLATPSKGYRLPFAPRQVLLFSGHMIDAPGRPKPRFPASKEPTAARAISDALTTLKAGPSDIGLCGGACGGDLLFAEACLRLDIHLLVLIPFDEPAFLKQSVTFAGGDWPERYARVTHHVLASLFVMPEELGPTPQGTSPYERHNLWMLRTALSLGPQKVRFICLWDGKGGDGPGGTKHMHDEVLRSSGQVTVIDVGTL